MYVARGRLSFTLTWSLLSRTVSVVLFPPGLAAFQNCFCAEYLFMGHSLNRQSTERERENTHFIPAADKQNTSITHYSCKHLYNHTVFRHTHAQLSKPADEMTR